MSSDETARFDPGVDKDEYAELAAKDPVALASVMEALSGADRRGRQNAARVIAALAGTKPVVLRPYADALADALERPELARLRHDRDAVGWASRRGVGLT